MKIDETQARQFVKKLKDECKGYKYFYAKINGREPTKQEVQTLTNYVNRSSYSMAFVLKIINAFDLQHVTFEQFCSGKVPPRPNQDKSTEQAPKPKTKAKSAPSKPRKSKPTQKQSVK